MKVSICKSYSHVSCRGSVMFVVIGALVVMGIIGAAVSRLTGSSDSTELQENKLDGAYYSAYSGLQFLQYAEKNKLNTYADLKDYTDKVTKGSPYVLPSGVGQFSVVLTPKPGSETSYTVSSLVGSVVGGTDVRGHNYLLTCSGDRTFGTSPVVPEKWLKYVQVGSNVTTSSAMGTKGNILATNNLSIVENNTVEGNIIAYNNITTGSGVVITGSVYAEGNVAIGPNSTISKSIQAIGNVTIGSATKTSSIASNGNVVLEASKQSISGNINAAGNVTISSGSVVDGDIIAGGNVVLDPSGCQITGNIYAGGNVSISSGSHVDKAVVADGNVDIASSDVVVKSGVSSGGNIRVGSSFRTVGGLTASGNITLSNGSSVGTDINSGGDLSITGGSNIISQNVYVGRSLTIEGASKILGNASVGGDVSLSGWGACIAKETAVSGSIRTDCKGTTCGDGNCYLKIGGSVKAPLSPETPKEPTPVVKMEREEVPNPPYNKLSTDGKLSVPNGGTKTFTSGTYYYSKIETAYGSKLQFDLSKGDITIFATGDVKLDNSTKIFISSDGKKYLPMADVDQSLAAKIYLESNSNISVLWAADWFGTLFSRGNISFDGGNTVIGMVTSLSGNTSSSGGTTEKITYVVSNYALREWYKD